MFLVPVAGLLAFAVIGSRRLPKRRRERQRYVDEAIRASALEQHGELVADARIAGITRLGQSLGAMPVVGGSSVDLDAHTEPLFAAMGAAAARGVTVRVLFDHLASLCAPGYRAMRARLRSDGVHAQPMLPVWPTTREWLRPDLHNHRKLLVVDGTVGFTGSQNIVDPSHDEPSSIRRGLQWVDLVARVEGPLVTELGSVFRTDWYSETGDGLPGEAAVATPVAAGAGPAGGLQVQVLPSGPGFPSRNNLRVFTGLVHAAQEHLVVSPYFVPDESLMLAITSAAHRGVYVELFVCAEGDQWLVHHAQRSYYPQLLEAGVEIWLYPAPHVLHTKLVRVDEDVVAFGSSNLDMRSFELDLELTLLASDADRSWVTTVADNVARLASAVV